jgi:hypothetical protein
LPFVYTGEEAKTAWEGLKKQFTNYLRKINGKTGDARKAIPKFRHAEAMKFYRDYYKPYS